MYLGTNRTSGSTRFSIFVRRSFTRTKRIAALLTGIIVVASSAAWSQTAETLVALGTGNQLFRFSSATPGVIDQTVTVSGVAGNLVALDVRIGPSLATPNLGSLYALGLQDAGQPGATGTLYVLNPDTFAVTSQVALTGILSPLEAGTLFDIDFNPVVGNLRVVGDQGQNFLVNPDTGAIVLDSDIQPSDETIVQGIAYNNNTIGAATTQLFDLDFFDSSLIQQAEVGGVTTEDVPLNVGGNPQTTDDIAGFDVSPLSGIAYSAIVPTGATTTFTLYEVNLSNAALTSRGTIGSGFAPGGILSIAALDLQAAAIPEPSAGVLLLCGSLLSLPVLRRGRSRRE